MTTNLKFTSLASRFNALVFTLFLTVVAQAFAASQAEVVLPKNGDTHLFTKSKRIAPLQIVTSGEKAHYFVKLFSADSNKTVQTVFVRSGETVTTKVPLGSYGIKYAAGQNWNGDQQLFGEETQFFEAEKRFDFIREGNEIQGFRIELILQPGGNLSTRQIPKADW
ncbi:MAG: hypothetical protein WCH01_09065 [Methylococcaceae bacterium]